MLLPVPEIRMATGVLRGAAGGSGAVIAALMSGPAPNGKRKASRRAVGAPCRTGRRYGRVAPVDYPGALFMRNPVRVAMLAALVVLAAPTALLAQSRDEGRSAGDRLRETTAAAIADAWAVAPVEETEAVTRHSIAAHGRTIRYTATAGTLTIRNDQGMPTASLFYVAYTADGADRARRPVTFLYNGGPGSASIWLHMGSFGPVRVQTDEPEVVRPAPFAFGPNPDTLLDRTDLVFIDMVGAGYSRPLGATPGSAFWGVDQDADAFTRAILRYVTKHDRWTSPKYILGESYGTLRAGAVAYQLHDRGMA